MKIIIKNLFGKPLPETSVELFNIKTRTNEFGKDRFEEFTNNEGVARFSVKEGKYLLHTCFKNYTYETILILKNEDSKVRLNTIWGLIKRTKEIPDEYLCALCKYEYDDMFYDRRKCSYCGNHHCSAHKMPEKHFCRATIMSPPKDVRTIYDGDKTEIKY